MLNRKTPIVIIADPGGRPRPPCLGRIGFDEVAGFLADGMLSLESRRDLTVTTKRVSAPFAAELLSIDPPPLAVDVRMAREYDERRLPGSVSLPLNHLVERLESLSKQRPLLVYCAAGYRSSIGASLLRLHGFDDVSEISGGIEGWQAAGLPVELGRAAGSAPQLH